MRDLGKRLLFSLVHEMMIASFAGYPVRLTVARLARARFANTIHCDGKPETEETADTLCLHLFSEIGLLSAPGAIPTATLK
jgi:hypothetical protein